MTVYLIRHGDAKLEEVDPTRPLSDRGWAEAERMARHLATLRLPVAEIRHSDKLRARQTAQVLAQHLAPINGIREARGLNPMDDPAIVRDDIETFPESLMLVGHLPHLGRLAQSLLGTDREIFDFPPVAVVCLMKAKGGWLLQWVLTPDSIP